LKEAAAKERADALMSASAAVGIETVMMTTTVSQQSTSSSVTVVAAATTPLMAGHIFRDILYQLAATNFQSMTVFKKLQVIELMNIMMFI
jgi:hypothetical protein